MSSANKSSQQSLLQVKIFGSKEPAKRKTVPELDGFFSVRHAAHGCFAKNSPGVNQQYGDIRMARPDVLFTGGASNRRRLRMVCDCGTLFSTNTPSQVRYSRRNFTQLSVTQPIVVGRQVESRRSLQIVLVFVGLCTAVVAVDPFTKWVRNPQNTKSQIMLSERSLLVEVDSLATNKDPSQHYHGRHNVWDLLCGFQSNGNCILCRHGPSRELGVG